MVIIRHRVNTLLEISNVETKYGVEIDLRSHNGEIIVSHDPFTANPIFFDEWLKFYNHNILILNVKEEGIEKKVLAIVKQHKVENFFFLDQTFPLIVKTLKSGETRTSIRISDYESLSTLERFEHLSPFKPNWVWIDSLTGNWEHLSYLADIKKMGYRGCLASPELHQRKMELDLVQIFEFIKMTPIDSVCTKHPERWSLD